MFEPRNIGFSSPLGKFSGTFFTFCQLQKQNDAFKLTFNLILHSVIHKFINGKWQLANALCNIASVIINVLLIPELWLAEHWQSVRADHLVLLLFQPSISFFMACFQKPFPNTGSLTNMFLFPSHRILLLGSAGSENGLKNRWSWTSEKQHVWDYGESQQTCRFSNIVIWVKNSIIIGN